MLSVAILICWSPDYLTLPKNFWVAIIAFNTSTATVVIVIMQGYSNDIWYEVSTMDVYVPTLVQALVFRC